jgi:hypothetical protein
MLAWPFLVFYNIQAPFSKNVGIRTFLTHRVPVMSSSPDIPDVYDEFYHLRVKFVTQKIISSMTCFCENFMSS